MDRQNNITELTFKNLTDVLKNVEEIIESLSSVEAITPALRAQIEELYKYADENTKERKVKNGCACVVTGQKWQREIDKLKKL